MMIAIPKYLRHLSNSRSHHNNALTNEHGEEEHRQWYINIRSSHVEKPVGCHGEHTQTHQEEE